MNIIRSNPDFVLKENWMNLIFGNFLFKHFENGRLNDDDLFMAIKNIIFEKGNNPDSLNLLSFFYEYKNGLNSSIPVSFNDLNIEIIGKMADQDLPKSIKHLDKLYDTFLDGKNMNRQEIALFKEYFNETIQLIKSKPDSDQIRAHFDFNPECSFKESFLKSFPISFQVAFFNLILPICDNTGRFLEALRMASSTYTFPPILYDQLNQKYPAIAGLIFIGNGSLLPAGKRAEHQKRTADIVIIGLDYLLSRNSKNPFNLKELTDMSPDISQLIKAFLPCNTMSLTEIDMIVQMKEAGLFSEIQDENLLRKIDMVIHGTYRLHTFFYLFSKSRIY